MRNSARKKQKEKPGIQEIIIFKTRIIQPVASSVEQISA